MTTPSPHARSSKYLRTPVPVHFPEAALVPESKRHLDQRTALYQILTFAFRDRALIGSDQFVYWDPTDPRQCLAPDVFVRFGAPDEQFRSWKVWERGAPDVAVEILSAGDERDRNFDDKLERYRRLGVRELVVFDPEADSPTLRLWDAVEGDLVERELDGLTAPSLCLPGTWVIIDDLLRLAHPDGAKLFPTPAEYERELRAAAEQRVRDLEAELRRTRSSNPETE
jgi:Uma2 family endonuclease